jgi:hypothetical protein
VSDRILQFDWEKAAAAPVESRFACSGTNVPGWDGRMLVVNKNCYVVAAALCSAVGNAPVIDMGWKN